jgi:hypothetical protein
MKILVLIIFLAYSFVYSLNVTNNYGLFKTNGNEYVYMRREMADELMKQQEINELLRSNIAGLNHKMLNQGKINSLSNENNYYKIKLELLDETKKRQRINTVKNVVSYLLGAGTVFGSMALLNRTIK